VGHGDAGGGPRESSPRCPSTFVSASPDDTIRFVSPPARAPGPTAPTLTSFTVAIPRRRCPPARDRSTFQTTAPGTSFAGGTGQSIQVSTDAGRAGLGRPEEPPWRSPREESPPRSTASPARSSVELRPRPADQHRRPGRSARGPGCDDQRRSTSPRLLRHDQGFASDGTAVDPSRRRKAATARRHLHQRDRHHERCGRPPISSPNTTAPGTVTITVGGPGHNSSRAASRSC